MIASLFATLGLTSPSKKNPPTSPSSSSEGNTSTDALNNNTTETFAVKLHHKSGSDQTSDTVSVVSDTDNEENDNSPWRNTVDVINTPPSEKYTENQESVSMNALKSILGSTTKISMVASEPSLVKPLVT